MENKGGGRGAKVVLVKGVIGIDIWIQLIIAKSGLKAGETGTLSLRASFSTKINTRAIDGTVGFPSESALFTSVPILIS